MMSEQLVLDDPDPMDIESPSLLNFHSIWQGLDPDFENPRVGTLEPFSLQDHIPLTFVVDHDRETERFRIKSMGSEYLSKLGRDYTGQYIDQINFPSRLMEILWAIVFVQRPYLARNMRLPRNSGRLTHYNFIACPFFDSNRDVSEIWVRTELEPNRIDLSSNISSSLNLS